jgi:hypothetical protein
MGRTMSWVLPLVATLGSGIVTRPPITGAAIGATESRDSIKWDTLAWAQIRNARAVTMRPASADSLVTSFLTEIYGNVGRLRTAIRDQAPWDSLWAQITSHGQWGGLCCRSTPNVDFRKDMILVAGNGYQNDGHEIAIVRVAEAQDTLYAFVLTSSEMYPGCTLDSRINSLAVARIARSQAPVAFVEGSRLGSCGRAGQ